MPVFEATAVFARSIGETTDVVSKEMYTFEDRGGDSLTLRPEFTAGIARAYLTEGWQQYAPLKLATQRPGVPLRAPAKGAVPPVPPDRRRGDRRGRAGGGRRIAGVRRPVAARTGHRRGRDAAAQHAGRRRDARRLARGAGRAFRGASRRAERGQPGAARQEPDAHPRLARTRATARSPMPRRISTRICRARRARSSRR